MKVKRALKVMLKIALPVGIIGFGPLCAFTVGKVQEHEKAVLQNEKDKLGSAYDYFLHTESGASLKLEMPDNSLTFVLGNNIKGKCKENIDYALSQIKDILPNKEIKVYYKDNAPKTKKFISIGFAAGLVNAEEVGGVNLEYNKKTGYINYPLYINILHKYKDAYYDEKFGEIPSNSAVSTILQHEIGHVLGLKDLRYKDKEVPLKDHMINSVMASNLYDGTTEFSSVDKFNLQKMYYPEGAVEAIQYQVSYPKTITITNLDKQKDKYKQDEVTL